MLAWLLSVFALGVFGYVTATIAAHLLGPERASELRQVRRQLRDLHAEMRALRRQLESASVAQDPDELPR